MKKVLFIVPSMAGGGVERVMLNLINALDKRKYEVDILAIKSGGELVNEIPKGVGYSYTWPCAVKIMGKQIPGTDRLFAMVYKKLSSKVLHRIFVKNEYDIEIDYWGQEGLKIVEGAGRKCVKLAFIHSDMNTESMRNAIFPYDSKKSLKKAYASMNFVVNVSEDCRKSMIERFQFELDDSRLVTKYNLNLNKDIICKSLETIEEWDKQNGESQIICAVGRLEKVKGFDRLVDICERLKKDQIDFKLFILGQGSEKDNLEQKIRNLNLEGEVKLLGFQSNPYKYMAKADIFVCSSYYEGFSTVVSEAVILGVPVVTTDCTGAREILGDSQYGIITHMDNESLYQGIKVMLTEQEVYVKYKEKVQERQKFFDFSQRLVEIEKLFEG